MERVGHVSGQTSQPAVEVWIQRFNEGAGHFNAGRIAEAEASFRQAADLQPNHPTIHFNRGLALRMLGRHDEAGEALRTTLRLKGDHVDALFHLGAVLMDQRRMQEAQLAFRQVLAVRPDYPTAALSLGNARMHMDQSEQALPAYRLAVVVDPTCANSTNNLGAAFMSLCREDDAAPFYRRAIRLVPGSAEYHKNLGTCQLKAGDFDEGGREYEWREEQAVWKWKRSFPGKARWDGAPLAGRTLLVHFEQGIGDTFQYIRYLAVAKAMGARTVFECQPSLKRFLACAPGIDVLVGHGEPLPDFDVHAPLMSMPYLCRSTPATIPGGVPYLAPEPELAAAWRRRMAEDVFRIGINWHANEVNRSIPLELFEGIARIPGVRLHSLQKVVGLDQLERLRDRLGIVDWTAGMDAGSDGFVDTAAVMANMDLIISCDTAVNHLAGAMGLNAILVARWFGDWRWMRIPDSSPFYPTMRLFRMAHRNDWAEVMGRVTAEVARQAAVKQAAGKIAGRAAVPDAGFHAAGA